MKMIDFALPQNEKYLWTVTVSTEGSFSIDDGDVSENVTFKMN